MSGLVNNGAVTYPSSSLAAAPYLRVKNNSGVIALAGSGEREIGTLEGRVLNTDTKATVLPMGIGGARKFVAAGAISQWADVYTAAAGKVDAAGVTNEEPIGVALEAASGDGSQIKVLMYAPRTMV